MQPIIFLVPNLSRRSMIAFATLLGTFAKPKSASTSLVRRKRRARRLNNLSETCGWAVTQPITWSFAKAKTCASGTAVAQSFADALFPPADYENGPPLPWIRGVLRNSEPVTFIMCADPTEQQKDPWLWRLLVDKPHQRCGVGRFAVKSVLARYREMGCTRVLVCWAPTEGNAH